MEIVKRNVLIFPGGTEIGLEIWNSLKECKEINLFSVGSPLSNHAPYVFNYHTTVPDVHSDNWLNELNSVLKEYDIDYIFPAHDDVIVALACNSDNINADIISSPLKTCLITRSKTETYNKFKDLLPIPKIFKYPLEIETFPVFVKPDKGQGSQNTFKVNRKNLLKILLDTDPDLITLEYLEGNEYTVDCFTDRKKGLLFCGGRERIRTRNGISMDSKPVIPEINEIFQEYGQIISDEIELYGAWFFQMKLDSSGNYKLLEIAPRISGTMATHRVLGINFPLLSIYEKEGVDIDIMINEYTARIDRALINRYKHNINYKNVYVDLDDTIIINNKINTQIMKFLFQAINEGCKLILITKTINDLDRTLKNWRLTGIFDEIILLNKDESKADYIEPKDSILIDDSFSERRSVFEKHKIPTFDSSMIELLLDWKF